MTRVSNLVHYQNSFVLCIYTAYFVPFVLKVLSGWVRLLMSEVLRDVLQLYSSCGWFFYLWFCSRCDKLWCMLTFTGFWWRHCVGVCEIGIVKAMNSKIKIVDVRSAVRRFAVIFQLWMVFIICGSVHTVIISMDCKSFWHKDSRENRLFWGILIFHLT